jgi:hypothetical protein
MVTYTQITTTSYGLTSEGLEIADQGSHEYRFWAALPSKGGEPLAVPELKVSPTSKFFPDTSYRMRLCMSAVLLHLGRIGSSSLEMDLTP